MRPAERALPLRVELDPLVEGERYRLPAEVIRALWSQAVRDVTDRAGGHDPADAWHRFHDLAARLAARRRDAGRQTRVAHELDGRNARSAGAIAPRAPGRDTRVAAEARREADRAARFGEPAAVRQPLDDATRRAVEATTGVALGDVVVERDAELGAGRLGEVTGNVIRLAAGLPGADEPLGRTVRIHEAIHVAQARITESVAPADRTAAVEAEAHAATAAAERGAPRPLAVKADPARAYAFDLADAAGALGVDPMGFVRAQFPQLAQFFDGGLAPLLHQLGDAAAAPLGATLDGVGTAGLGHGLRALVASFAPAHLAHGFDTGCCECLDHALADLLTSVKGALRSDTAQTLRRFLETIQDAQTGWILDGIADFFQALQRFGAPVVAAIERAGALIARADAALGRSVLWRAIAPRLGLDPDLSPVEAIKHKLAALWAGVTAAVAALKQKLAALWAKIKANPAVAAALKLAGDLGALVAAIDKVREAKSRDPKVWLGILARELKGTVFADLVARLQSGYASVLGFRDDAVAWLTGILDELGLLAAWNASVPYLNAIGRAIQGFARTARAVVAAIAAELKTALGGAAGELRAIWQAVEPYVNFVVGLGAAIARTASGDIFAIPRFAAGELWLHALPHCYKEALANFLLDVFAELIEWFPAKHPVMIVLRSAALGFVRAVRAADPASKVGAMDTIAKVMANHVDVLAGFFVGLVTGLWHSSLGFLAQMIVLPFELGWDVLKSIGSSVAGLAGKTFGAVFDGATWLVDEMARARPVGGEEPAPRDAQPAPEPAQPVVDTTVEVDPSSPPTGTEDTPDAEVGRGGTAPGTTQPGPGPGAQPADPAGAQPDGDRKPPGGGDAFEDPPPFPALPPLHDLLDDIFKKGISREQIEQAFAKLGLAAASWGERFGAEGAKRLLPALTAHSAPYDAGKVLGEVIGWFAGEIITLVATQGIENAIAKLAEGALEGARILARIGEYFPKLVAWLADMRKLVEPLLAAVEHIAARAKQFVQQLLKWLDDMAAWVRRQWARLLVWLEQTLGAAGKAIRKRLGNLARTPGAIEAEAEALAAANAAFEEVDATLLREAVPLQTIEARLRAARVPHTPDVAIRLHLVTTTHWRVEATAIKGSHRGVGLSLGRGAVMFAHRTRLPYYTASGHSVRHNELLELAWLELEREAALVAEAPGPHTLAADYERVHAIAQRVARRYDEMLPLRGTTHFLIQLEPLDSRNVQDNGVSDTDFIITPNTLHGRRPVHIRRVKAAFGAVAAGTGFSGSFDPSKVVGGTAWNYDNYPSGPITRHPANEALSYSNVGRLGSLKPPPIAYTFVGGSSPGGSAADREHWRRLVRDQMHQAKKNFKHQGEEEDDAEELAMQQTLAHYHAKGYPGLSWNDLVLEGNNDWQAHHIQEHSWGGNERKTNMQYLKRYDDHQKLTNWWNDRRDDIKAGLR
jgi:hypothetical protein